MYVKLVVDANVFFSAFLKPGLTRKLWLDEGLQLFAPFTLIEEYKKYSAELIGKTNFDKKGALLMEVKLFDRLSFVDKEEMLPYNAAALHLTVDSKDVVYVAAALATGADLWSHDKHLRQPRIKCWGTEELARELGHLQ